MSYAQNNLTCPQCGSRSVKYHDGLLGYEAIRCQDCGKETDLNQSNNCDHGVSLTRDCAECEAMSLDYAELQAVNQ